MRLASLFCRIGHELPVGHALITRHERPRHGRNGHVADGGIVVAAVAVHPHIIQVPMVQIARGHAVIDEAELECNVEVFGADEGQHDLTESRHVSATACQPYHFPIAVGLFELQDQAIGKLRQVAQTFALKKEAQVHAVDRAVLHGIEPGSVIEQIDWLGSEGIAGYLTAGVDRRPGAAVFVEMVEGGDAVGRCHIAESAVYIDLTACPAAAVGNYFRRCEVVEKRQGQGIQNAPVAQAELLDRRLRRCCNGRCYDDALRMQRRTKDSGTHHQGQCAGLSEPCGGENHAIRNCHQRLEGLGYLFQGCQPEQPCGW